MLGRYGVWIPGGFGGATSCLTRTASYVKNKNKTTKDLNNMTDFKFVALTTIIAAGVGVYLLALFLAGRRRSARPPVCDRDE